nr:rpl22 [Engelhardia fenzelii]
MIKKKRSNPYTKVCALSKHKHMYMSTNKARRIIDKIRGRSYQERLMVLELMPYQACYPLLKLVYSAAANTIHNMGLNESSLIISKVEVNESTTVKKLSTNKARRIIDKIRGRSYQERLMVLELMPYQACYPLLKLVYSAAANTIHNMGLNESSLIISKVEVNESTTVKK